MQYVCDAPGSKTWFRIETEAEAARESDDMGHAVEKYFRQAAEQAARTYVPRPGPFIEQDIGLKAHVQRTMPMFLTLRDREGNGLATAMLPPAGRDEQSFKTIIVGVRNSDPFSEHGDAIRALARHFDLTLDRARCFPY
jgi:hypothetical protein